MPDTDDQTGAVPPSTSPATSAPPPRSGGTRDDVFEAAERLFALNGFQKISVRDITTEAGVNIASINYHFGSKDALLLEIFSIRAAELNRERARMLHAAMDRHAGKPPIREILAALFAPPLLWLKADDRRRLSLQFILRVRSEGTQPMRDALRGDVSHLQRFVDALKAAQPDLPEETLYWRLHFCLGLIHNNRIAEFERLHRLSKGVAGEIDAEALLARMLDFAEAGMRA